MADFRLAPDGFTRDQWETFSEQGFLHFSNILSDHECDRYQAAIDQVATADSSFKADKYYSHNGIVATHPAFTDLIDRDTHIGYAYDLYGELTKVHLSVIMRRPFATTRNPWHPDGARLVPYNVFSPELPLQFKVGYWFTALPQENMGNLTVLPGSHRQQYMDAYDTRDVIDGEHQLICTRGSMTLMHGSLWHKVAPNESDQVRYNAFIAYCPGWIVAADRHRDDESWLQTLNREQRILMRSYANPYHNTKAPAADVPLFLDRDTGADRDPDCYQDHVELHRRKRLLFHEKLARESTL